MNLLSRACRLHGDRQQSIESSLVHTSLPAPGGAIGVAEVDISCMASSIPEWVHPHSGFSYREQYVVISFDSIIYNITILKKESSFS